MIRFFGTRTALVPLMGLLGSLITKLLVPNAELIFWKHILRAGPACFKMFLNYSVFSAYGVEKTTQVMDL